jgi:hypothetical protein
LGYYFLFVGHSQSGKKDISLSLDIYNNNSENIGIPGATVIGHDGAGVAFSQNTNSVGSVVINGAPGNWKIDISCLGYGEIYWEDNYTSDGIHNAFLDAN